jgi:hypothetical protein
MGKTINRNGIKQIDYFLDNLILWQNLLNKEIEEMAYPDSEGRVSVMRNEIKRIKIRLSEITI